MDLRAPKSAATADLIAGAVGAAANARDLLDDSDLLAGAGRYARAYSLAVMAVEEAGKAASLAVLAIMPEGLRQQAPTAGMLEWHHEKMIGGILLAGAPFVLGGTAARLAAMPQAEVSQILDEVQAFADGMDRLKLRGLYVDIDHHGKPELPSEVTEADVAALLIRARPAVSKVVSELLDPGAPAKLAHPTAVAIELSRAFAEAGRGPSPRAAAHVWLTAIGRFQQTQNSRDDVDRA